jgi:hypothetical protein
MFNGVMPIIRYIHLGIGVYRNRIGVHLSKNVEELCERYEILTNGTDACS